MPTKKQKKLEIDAHLTANHVLGTIQVYNVKETAIN